MRKSSGFGRLPPSDRHWIFVVSLVVAVILVVCAVLGLFSPPYYDPSFFDTVPFVDIDQGADESHYEESQITNVSSDYHYGEPPRIAYLITGTKGDGQRMKRVLQAVYHPRNHYIIHLDLEAPPKERIELAMYVKGEPMFAEVENVRVIAKANLVTYKGPTMIACTLHAVAMLLKEGLQWDWFINLSASDYPIMTQDDMLHVISSVPRNLNFIEHNLISGWKLFIRGKPIVVDPGLYLSKKTDLVLTADRRDLPTAFKLYTGSAWVMLTRTFLQYCIWAWDNLPRSVLMYYVNSISSPEGYFHTVICNSDEFQGTVIGHDLHYISWDNPPKQHPLVLSGKDFKMMVKSGMPFARKFAKDDKVLDKIDRELLGRSDGQFTPGAWCVGSSEEGVDPCTCRGNDSIFRPGPGAERFGVLMRKILSPEYRNGSCSQLSYDQTKREWVAS